MIFPMISLDISASIARAASRGSPAAAPCRASASRRNDAARCRAEALVWPASLCPFNAIIAIARVIGLYSPYRLFESAMPLASAFSAHLMSRRRHRSASSVADLQATTFTRMPDDFTQAACLIEARPRRPSPYEPDRILSMIPAILGSRRFCHVRSLRVGAPATARH